MKKTLFDFFRREFQMNLSVSSRDTVSPRAEQWNGVAILSPEGNGIFREGNDAAIEECFAGLRDLHLKVLRIDACSPDFERWVQFCVSENISPHIVFTAETEHEKIRSAVEACRSRFSENDLWKPRRFYEIDCDPAGAAFENEEKAGDAADILKGKAEWIRELDPDAVIILSGIFPNTDSRQKAVFWNRVLLEKCASSMDLIGVKMFPGMLSGRVWDPDAEGIEVNASLAEEIRRGFRELDQQVRTYAPDTEIRAAVTGWGFLQDGEPQKRQDCIFYASVYSMLRMAADFAALIEAGPLFGENGLLSMEEGLIRRNVFFHILYIASSDLPVCLKVKENETDKPVPVYHWEGLPGSYGSADLKLLEIFASRSPESRRLFLFVTNRSAHKQAVPRIRFLDMPDMHPLKACIIRSKSRLDENSADDPEKVYCKELKLRNYRKMDHVTLEIPGCSTACMVLGD